MADTDESFALFVSRNVRRFCWRTDARRLPVAVAGGDAKILVDGRIDSIVTEDDSDGNNGVWNVWTFVDELSIVSSLTFNGYWCGWSILNKSKKIIDQ